VKRDHLVVLVERPSDGRRAVFCSVHLHPPQQIERARAKYLDYLTPLRTAIEKAAAGGDSAVEHDSGSNPGSLGSIDCFLVGDFNVSPEEFRSRTQHCDFWSNAAAIRWQAAACSNNKQQQPAGIQERAVSSKYSVVGILKKKKLQSERNQFSVCVPDGGETASSTNPCATGDFAVVAGSRWRGRSLGPSGFRAFDRYAEGITAAANRRIHLEAALNGFEQAVADCKGPLQRVVYSAEAIQRSCHSNGGSAAPHLRMALQQLRLGGRRFKEDLARTISSRHRKRLFTSDHRPLHYLSDI